MFKHRLNFNPYFACLSLLIIPFFSQIHWGFFYFAFFCIYGLGVGLGFHRILCHQIKTSKLIETTSIYFGVLSHAGSLKGSILWHINHHIHADTAYDTQKDYVSALKPRVDQMKVKLSQLRRPLQKVDQSKVLRLFEKYYYLVLIGTYIIFGSIFGMSNVIMYVIIPSSLALIVHSYSAVYIHRHGYRNFATPDRSHNSILLWPIMFGENWHNNHHQFPKRLNQQTHWWELDLIFCFVRLFTFPTNLIRNCLRSQT